MLKAEPLGKKSEKKFGPQRPPEGLGRGSWEVPRAASGVVRPRPPRPAIQETFSILGAVLEPQSRGVLV